MIPLFYSVMGAYIAYTFVWSWVALKTMELMAGIFIFGSVFGVILHTILLIVVMKGNKQALG